MADPNSNGEIRTNQDWEGAWTEQGREELANPDSSLRLNVREQISNKEKTQQRIMTVWINFRRTGQHHQRGITRGYKGGRIRNGKVSMDTLDVAVQHRQQGSDIWDIEPNVGRVAHGITDRVDDLDSWVTERPQTAARAWEVLNAETKFKREEETTSNSSALFVQETI